MTHKEAVEKLKKLANGSPWCLIHETGSYLKKTHIRAYIEGPGHAESAQTYAEAIRNAEIMLYPPIPDAPPEDEEVKS